MENDHGTVHDLALVESDKKDKGIQALGDVQMVRSQRLIQRQRQGPQGHHDGTGRRPLYDRGRREGGLQRQQPGASQLARER